MSPPETVREVAARLDGLRELLFARLDAVRVEVDALQRIVDERDGRYTERAEAQTEAIHKAEQAQASYNATHNDLTRKMERKDSDQMPRTEVEGRLRKIEMRESDQMPRSEVEGRLQMLSEKIETVRGVQHVGGGMSAGSRASQETARANVLLALAFFGAVVTGGGIVAAIAVALSR
jgi:hypothetical protein